MKRYKTYVLSLLMVGVMMPIVHAQTPSVTPVATDSAKQSVPEKEVQDLKDKIAKKVDELTKQKKTGISGIIQSISDKKIEIKAEDGTPYAVELDDVLTKYYLITGTKRTEGTLKSFSKGDFVIIVGPETNGDVVANAIYRDEQYLVGSGSVTEVNESDFYLKVVTTQKDNLTIDVETNTKRILVDSKTLDFETVGFSKIKEGDIVHYVLKKTGKEREVNRYPALRVVVIPQEYFMK